MMEIVKYWKTLPKSKQPGQGKPGQNTSFEHLAISIDDELIPVKLIFFEDIAKLLNSFLRVFQTDRPMAVFLAETLEELLRLLCCKFLSEEVLATAKNAVSLIKIDVEDRSNHLATKDINVGYSIRYELQILKQAEK